MINGVVFPLKGENHPISPVMLGDARLATEIADEMLQKGIYVIGFSYPVVPKGGVGRREWAINVAFCVCVCVVFPATGEARIRVQLSAVHTRQDIDQCVGAFIEIGKRRGVIH